MTAPRVFCVRATAPYACWTNPALTAERFSYPVPTPVGLEGVLKSVFWRKGLRYQIQSIGICAPIRRHLLRRNEIDHTPRADASTGFNGDRYAVQRMTSRLKDVDYRVEFVLDLDDGYRDRSLLMKCEAMLSRYLDRGHCFQQPFFGCREMVGDVRWAETSDPTPIAETRPLGRMIYGYIWDNARNRRDVVLEYEPHLDHGVVHVPPRGEVLRLNGVARPGVATPHPPAHPRRPRARPGTRPAGRSHLPTRSKGTAA